MFTMKNLCGIAFFNGGVCMDLRKIIVTSLFAALIVAGSYIAIPIGVVPITLQSMFVLLAGLIGGKAVGLSAVATYIVLGAIGLPVFSGGTGGFAHFATPTGGFLISWLVAAPVVGSIVDRKIKDLNRPSLSKGEVATIIFASIVGTLIFFLIGIPYLKLVLQVSWKQAIAIGLIPFIVGDLIKLVSAAILTNIFALKVRSYLNKENIDE